MSQMNKMNCIAFRSALDAAPTEVSSEMLAHRRECPACDAFAQRHEDLERKLGQAVRIDVPEELASHVLLAHSLRLKNTRRWWNGRVLAAVAASLVLGLALSWLALRTDPLARDVVAHIEGEPSALTERGEISPAQVREVLASLNITLTGDLGTVHHASVCWVGTRQGAHLVLSGDSGPVTVLILPGDPVRHRVQIAATRFAGTILPSGEASIAIVGEPGETLEAIVHRLQESVQTQARAGSEVAGKTRSDDEEQA